MQAQGPPPHRPLSTGPHSSTRSGRVPTIKVDGDCLAQRAQRVADEHRFARYGQHALAGYHTSLTGQVLPLNALPLQ